MGVPAAPSRILEEAWVVAPCVGGTVLGLSRGMGRSSRKKRERRQAPQSSLPDRPVGPPTPEGEIGLPDDPVILQQMVRELLERLARMEQGQEEQKRKIDELLRRLYGPKSERVNPDQLALFELERPEPTPESPPEESEKSRSRRGHGRRKLPANLPRRRVEH